MEVLAYFEGLSLLEMVIIGFIGLNISVSGVYLVQSGVKKTTLANKADD